MDFPNRKQLHLRCYAERDDDGSWFALCLDLNLYARSDTAKEVTSKLHEIVADYVNEAFNVDSAYATQLIPRRAPAYFWVRYYWIALVLRWRNKHKGGGDSFLFNDSVVHA